MGNSLATPVNSIYIERKNYNICKSIYSCIHGCRITNEDSHAMKQSNSNVVFNGIFDGHAGVECSNFVSRELSEKILERENLNAATIQSICLNVDDIFLSKRITSGTTATFSVIKKNEFDKFNVIIGNIGDSVTILLDKQNNYKIKFITTDHKPTMENEKKRIEDAGGVVKMDRVDGNLAISRAFGDIEYKSTDSQMKHKVIAFPDITDFECNEGDIIIHFCDGITESHFSPEEVANFVANNVNKYKDIGIVTSLICREALCRGSKDNLSCLITILGTNTESNASCYPEKETIPGVLTSCNRNFINAYQKMAEMSGETIVDSINKRIQIIKKITENKQHEREIDQILFDDISTDEISIGNLIIDDLNNIENSDDCFDVISESSLYTNYDFDENFEKKENYEDNTNNLEKNK